MKLNKVEKFGFSLIGIGLLLNFLGLIWRPAIIVGIPMVLMGYFIWYYLG